MNTTRKFLTVLVLALTLVVGTAMAAGAATDPNYTDGTETHSPNWGNPPEAPTMDVEEGSVCIDPPSKVWMTVHVIADGTEVDSLTFEYIHTVPGYACAPYELPVCPAEEIEVYGTWNIGTGRSPSLFVDNDCPDPFGELVVSGTCESGNLVTLKNTGEAAWTVDDGGPFDGQTIDPGADSTVDVGRSAGGLTVNFSAGPKSGEATVEWTDQATCPVPPPAEVVPPVALTATPVAPAPVCTAAQVANGLVPVGNKCQLPMTGKSTTPYLVGGGLFALIVGLFLTRASRSKRGLIV